MEWLLYAKNCPKDYAYIILLHFSQFLEFCFSHIICLGLYYKMRLCKNIVKIILLARACIIVDNKVSNGVTGISCYFGNPLLPPLADN